MKPSLSRSDCGGRPRWVVWRWDDEGLMACDAHLSAVCTVLQRAPHISTELSVRPIGLHALGCAGQRRGEQ